MSAVEEGFISSRTRARTRRTVARTIERVSDEGRVEGVGIMWIYVVPVCSSQQGRTQVLH